jgi:energy-coupling factor transporter transmembrane protein EcfT
VLALEGADQVGLAMAARSFRAKRQHRRNHRALLLRLRHKIPRRYGRA